MPDAHDDPVAAITEAIHDAAAVAVGLGIMAVNRVQAVRRQVAATAPESGDGPGAKPSDAP